MRLPGGIPLTIRPLFWLVAALLALLLGSDSLVQGALWVLVIFFSVLVHEYGHALTVRAFGQKPRIELIAMGGATFHEGDKLSFWKQFIITFNGPLFGFLLGTFAYFLSDFSTLAFQSFLKNIAYVNWFWTAVNLFPILPLDGGQLMRIVLEGIFHAKGVRASLLLSALIALVFSVYLFTISQFIPALVFLFFAFQNIEGFRKTHLLRDSDRDVHLKEAMDRAEAELIQGHKEEALQAFEKIKAHAKEGMLYTTASEYAALLAYESGKRQEAYQSLKDLKDELDGEGLCLLHQVAFEENDFQLVIELSGQVFQFLPLPDVALRNAFAAAQLSKVEETLGWLQAAAQEGVQNLPEIVRDKVFESLKGDPQFQKFIAQLEN